MRTLISFSGIVLIIQIFFTARLLAEEIAELTDANSSNYFDLRVKVKMKMVPVNTTAENPEFRGSAIKKPHGLIGLGKIVSRKQLSNSEDWKVALDSTVSLKKQKQTYTYNSFGQALTQYSFVWGSNSPAWSPDPFFGYEFYFDSKGRQSAQIYYNWDPGSAASIVRYKIESIYDPNGNISTENVYGQSLYSSELNLAEKYEYSYDTNKNPLLKIKYVQSSVSSTMDLNQKYEYSYDAQGRFLTESDYVWSLDSLIWIPSRKETHTYDVNGNTIEWKFFYWNSSSTTWMTSERWDCTFDTNGNELLEIHYDHLTDSLMWNPNEKKEYTYDIKRNLLTLNWYRWDAISSAWYHMTALEYTYDTNGNQLTEIQYCWDSKSSLWNRAYKHECVYDLSVPVTDIALPYTPYHENNKKVKNIESQWDNASNAWILPCTTAYYYSAFNVPIIASSVTPTRTQAISLSTTGNTILFSLGSYALGNAALYTLSGRRLICKAINSRGSMSIAYLVPGLYILEIALRNGPSQKYKILR